MASRCEILKAISVIAEIAARSGPDGQTEALETIQMICRDEIWQGAPPNEPDPAEGDAAQPGYTPDLPNPWYRSQDGLAYFHQPSGLQIVWESDMARWQIEFPGDRMRRGRFDDPSVAANWAEVEFARMAMQRANEKPG